MPVLAVIALLIVAALHAGFMALEMVFWTQPLGLRIFGLTPEDAAASAALAKNQGLYNGFLAAGLIWAALARRRDVAIFFCACVIVAGVFGAVTVKPTILAVQAAPGLVALVLSLYGLKD
ncbi:MAG: DUF1304 domain-containing protein [Pseudomonadota bacterium]